MKPVDAIPAGLARAWQREPWWSEPTEGAFRPPLDIDEIAGLATLPDVESLLVKTHRTDGKTEYKTQSGPFDTSTLGSLGEHDWTLLVRDLDRHLPELGELWTHFHWLADYRRADIMVSVAAPGGSVGPHRDSYDVFLVQGHGERCWQLAPGDDADETPDHPLRLTYPPQFTERVDATPGHTLYVPPGYIHHGVAQTLCTTWSFGLQAPLVSDIASMANLPGTHSPDERLRDPSIPVRKRHGEIPHHALAAVSCFDADDANALDALGLLLSTPKPGFEPDGASTPQGTGSLHPWTRLYWRTDRSACSVYCNGQMLVHSNAAIATLEQLSEHQTLSISDDAELFRWLSGCAAFE
ncbi:MAG: cupin domain-containing protein [Pseudomonadota bacterium]